MPQERSPLVAYGNRSRFRRILYRKYRQQETILSNRIGIISAELSKRLKISPSAALQLFYASKTCADLHDKETGLYLIDLTEL